MRQFFPLVALYVLSACATPTTAYTVAPPQAVQSEVMKQEQMVQMGRGLRESAPSPSSRYPVPQRVMAVAERVFIAAAPYCGWQTSTAYPVSVGVIGNRQPEVISAAGDLRPGDVVLGIQGQRVDVGRSGYQQLNEVGSAVAQRGQPLQISAARGNKIINTTYQPVAACLLPVKLHNEGEWNAYTDGEALHLDARLVKDLSNDDDLAFVMAHELAHALLGHVQKTQQNAMTGALVGLALEAVISGQNGMGGELSRAGAQAGQLHYSQAFEHEADYVGLYLLAETGYDLQAGPRVARRIAQQDPRSIHYASSHPSSAARAAGLAATIAEITAKQQSGQPVRPTMAQPQ